MLADPLYEMDDVIKHRLPLHYRFFLPPGFSSRKMTLMRPRSPDARSLIALQRKSPYRGERRKIGGQAANG
jgi:hypothetical protein